MTAASVNEASSESQRRIDRSNVFCIRIPVMRPTAVNSRGAVLIICLGKLAGLRASCRSISSNLRHMSSIAGQSTDLRYKTQGYFCHKKAQEYQLCGISTELFHSLTNNIRQVESQRLGFIVLAYNLKQQIVRSFL